MQPVIKWSGSKRDFAKEISNFFPEDIKTYYEPFLGGGSLLPYVKTPNIIAGDILEELMESWKLIHRKPDVVVEEYTKLWESFQKDVKFYYEVRDRFNETKNPHDFIFLTRTCVNGLIRYNRKGFFNSPVHFNRKGIQPTRFEKIVKEWSALLVEKNIEFISGDFSDFMDSAREGDFFLLDPPYAQAEGKMYKPGVFNAEDLFSELEKLNQKNVRWLLTYDGVSSDRNKQQEFVPKSLYKRKRELLGKERHSTFRKVSKSQKLRLVREYAHMNY